ncbi:MAG: hypothetical protein AAB932_03525, partial [Patescibacteria group bacterium]
MKKSSSFPLSIVLACTISVVAIAVTMGTVVWYSFNAPSLSLPVAEESAGEYVAENSSSPCTPQSLAELPVGGLGRSDVPRLPDALRVGYGDLGQTAYLTEGSETDVVNYYLATLAAQCWELSALAPHEAAWTKDGAVVKLAVAENPLGGKSLVNYEVSGGQVLGFRLAQTG